MLNPFRIQPAGQDSVFPRELKTRATQKLGFSGQTLDTISGLEKPGLDIQLA
jgi:hypothetical protein